MGLALCWKCYEEGSAQNEVAFQRYWSSMQRWLCVEPSRFAMKHCLLSKTCEAHFVQRSNFCGPTIEDAEQYPLDPRFGLLTSPSAALLSRSRLKDNPILPRVKSRLEALEPGDKTTGLTFEALCKKFSKTVTIWSEDREVFHKTMVTALLCCLAVGSRTQFFADHCQSYQRKLRLRKRSIYRLRFRKISMAFLSWQDFVEIRKRNRHLVNKSLRKLLFRLAGKAMHKWSEYTQQNLRVKRFIKRRVARRMGALTYHAFETWNDFTQEMLAIKEEKISSSLRGGALALVPLLFTHGMTERYPSRKRKRLRAN